MNEPQASTPVTGRGSPLTFVVTLALFAALILYLFNLPLNPTAWGGPSDYGPFEVGKRPGTGWLARNARLGLAYVAELRSPDQGLDATGEALAGYYAFLALARAVVLWIVLRRLGGSGLLASLGVVIALLPIVFGAPRQTESEMGLLFFVILLALTSAIHVPRWVTAGVLPALFVAWANAHSSIMIGLAWLSVITLGRAVEWWSARRRGERPRPAWLHLLAAIGLCAAAACINWDGLKTVTHVFRMVKNPNLASLPDWQPVDFSKPAGMPWAYFATLAALFVAQLLSPRVFRPTGLLVILSFGFWPLVQQRGLAYWWLIVPWLLVPMVAPIFRSSDGCADRAIAQRAHRTSIATSLWTWIALLVLGVAMLTTPAVRWLVTGQPRTLGDVVSTDTPWRVARELTADSDAGERYLPGFRDVVRATYPSGKYRGAILCAPSQGDFLAWVLDGDNTQPVMLYTRPETLESDALGRSAPGPGRAGRLVGNPRPAPGEPGRDRSRKVRETGRSTARLASVAYTSRRHFARCRPPGAQAAGGNARPVTI